MGKKVVWILGAGFSAGIGGPLLGDLFTQTSEKDLAARYGTKFPKLSDDAAGTVRSLYNYGSKELFRFRASLSVGEPGEPMWSDPEVFIDSLDTAAEPYAAGERPHWTRLKSVLTSWKRADVITDVDALRTSARRLIAAECCAFLEGIDVESERWQPFRAWERGLGPDDTLISFNYDRVVEMLKEARGASKISVVLPAPKIDLEDHEGCCLLLKLHGSVDWKKTKGERGTTVVIGERLHALKCEASELAIATPGPSKLRETEDFKSLWDVARAAISEAAAVVFLGYRFPETDAFARRSLLQAISKNTADKLSLHAVLGLPSPASQRLKALLEFAGDRRPRARPNPGGGGERLLDYVVRVDPLYGQDFLSVFQRESL